MRRGNPGWLRVLNGVLVFLLIAFLQAWEALELVERLPAAHVRAVDAAVLLAEKAGGQ